MDPTQSQRLQYTSSSTFRKPDKPSPATAVDFMYDSGKTQNDENYFFTLLPKFSSWKFLRLGDVGHYCSRHLWPVKEKIGTLPI